jgi:hypothetical protein
MKSQGGMMFLRYLSGIVIVITMLVPCSHGAEPQCIAYLRNNKIRIQCDGTTETLLRSSSISMYAIDAVTIATTATKVSDSTDQHRLVGDDKVVLISGTQERTVHLPSGIRFLYSSCGTILATLADGKDTTWDVIAGKPFEGTALRRPVCSRDKTHLIGINSSGQLVLQSGTLLAGPGQFGRYAMSPSGNAYALFRRSADGLLRLCIGYTSQKSERCSSSEVIDNSAASIDDQGRTLFVRLTDDTCYFSKGKSTQRKTTDSVSGQCFEVTLLTYEGAQESVALLGSFPSWVSKTLEKEVQRRKK